MKSRHQLRATIRVDAPAKPRDRIERPKQRLRAELPERDDHLRADDVDLLEEKRLAGFDLVLLGVAVLRRTALDDVRNVDVVAPEPDRLDDLRQQLAGAADERLALDVFVAARRLADEHQVGVRIADTEHDLRASEPMQLAPRAIADVRANSRQRLGGVCRERQRRRGADTSVGPYGAGRGADSWVGPYGVMCRGGP